LRLCSERFGRSVGSLRSLAKSAKDRRNPAIPPLLPTRTCPVYGQSRRKKASETFKTVVLIGNHRSGRRERNFRFRPSTSFKFSIVTKAFSWLPGGYPGKPPVHRASAVWGAYIVLFAIIGVPVMDVPIDERPSAGNQTKLKLFQIRTVVPRIAPSLMRCSSLSENSYAL
jgi:hypothetical protein